MYQVCLNRHMFRQVSSIQKMYSLSLPKGNKHGAWWSLLSLAENSSPAVQPHSIPRATDPTRLVARPQPNPDRIITSVLRFQFSLVNNGASTQRVAQVHWMVYYLIQAFKLKISSNSIQFYYTLLYYISYYIHLIISPLFKPHWFLWWVPYR